MANLQVVRPYFALLLAYSTAAYTSLSISPGNRVVVAGTTTTFTCGASSSSPLYWHYYALSPTLGSTATPCSFDSARLYYGISLCPTVPRISVSYSTAWRNRTTLTISRAQMSDAGTYTCGNRNPHYLSTARSVIVGVIASYPSVTSSVTEGCIPQDQNVSLTCKVTYNGTNLMPLVLDWYWTNYASLSPWYFDTEHGRSNTVNASSVFQSTWTFMAAGGDFYWCKVGFSYPTGLVVPGVEYQYRYPYTSGNYWSSPVAPEIANCSASEIEFSVNSRAVDSGATLMVGDVLTCSAQGALSYRWTNAYNGGDEVTYGNTVRISQPGDFNYECNVFVDCGTGVICPFLRNITGFARELVNAEPSTRPTSISSSAHETGFQDESNYKSEMVAFAVLFTIVLVGLIALGAAILYGRFGHKLFVRSSCEDAEGNEVNVHAADSESHQYVNSFALTAVKDDERACSSDLAGDNCQNSSAVYEDLSLDARSAEPIVYETVKPRVATKPRPGHSNC